MPLEELILSDYGNIPQKIGSYLLRHNPSTLKEIEQSVGLSEIQIKDGLFVLIQRRMVKFFAFERVLKYFIDRSILKRRLYFSIYQKYISQAFSSKHAKYFMKVLLSGTVQELETNEISDEFLQKGIFSLEMNGTSRKRGVIEEEHSAKQAKPSNRFVVVNFDILDQRIYEEEMINLVNKKYNEAAGTILRSILKCDVVDRDNIIANLESTKILISDNGSIINDKENVNEYLNYLCNSKIVIRGLDEKRAWFFNSSRKILKFYRICVLLKDTAMRRVFSMIYNRPYIEDKDITIHSLLSISKVKNALLALQKMGLISQKCSSDYSSSSRIDHLWFVDIDLASLSIRKRIESKIHEKILNANSCWDMNHYFGSSIGNDNVWISDMVSLATDHLIFGMDC